MRGVALLLAGALLAACGNQPIGEARLLQTLAESIRTPDDAGPRPDLPEGAALSAGLGLSPAQLQEIGRPILFVEMRPSGLVAGLLEQVQNGAHTTWITQDKITVTERGGIVTATRGLAGDLMSADVADVQAALVSGGGSATRVHHYLDDENGIVTRAWTCRLVPTGAERVAMPGGARRMTLVVERCTGAAGDFENRYWSVDGVVRQSVQHVRPGARVMRLQHYRP